MGSSFSFVECCCRYVLLENFHLYFHRVHKKLAEPTA